MNGKILKRAVAVVAVFAIVIAAVSCSAEDKVERNSKEYLEEKYGDLDFELVGYTQNKSTNGWYIMNARCNDTGVDFEMYVSSIRITDGYGVSYANATMEEKLINGAFEPYADRIESVTWLSEFEDGYENYTFKTVDISQDFEISDVKSLEKVVLKDCNLVSTAASVIYDMVLSLEEYGVVLGESEFDFTVGSFDYTVLVDYGGLDILSKDGFTAKMLSREREAKRSILATDVKVDFTASALMEMGYGIED